MRFRHSSSVLAITLAVASTSLAGALPAYAAAARTAEKIGVPDHSTLTIRTRGNGHNHGMSQYGAEGAARKGLSAKQIVQFYYPHTKAGQLSRKVLVEITADIDDNTTVVNRSGLAVHDLKGGGTTRLPTSGKAGHASRWRMTAGAGGRTRVSFRNDGWHLWKKLSGDGEFRAARPIKLVLGSGNVVYRGWLQSRTNPDKQSHRVTVNKASLESYVQGVVPREIPPSWHRAALRAQAIAARSYAAQQASENAGERWNLCDTTSCQVYGGKTSEQPSTNAATAATKGQIRTYRGKPAFTQFSASNGGWLVDGGKPYLVTKKDPYDDWSGNPYDPYTKRVSASAIENAFPVVGNLTSITIDKRDGNGKWNGRVLDMTLHGSGGTTSISGATFQSRLGLYSNWFDISVCSTCNRSLRLAAR